MIFEEGGLYPSYQHPEPRDERARRTTRAHKNTLLGEGLASFGNSPRVCVAEFMFPVVHYITFAHGRGEGGGGDGGGEPWNKAEI